MTFRPGDRIVSVSDATDDGIRIGGVYVVLEVLSEGARVVFRDDDGDRRFRPASRYALHNDTNGAAA